MKSYLIQVTKWVGVPSKAQIKWIAFMEDKLSFFDGIDFCVIIQILHIIDLDFWWASGANELERLHTNDYIRLLEAIARAILHFDGVMDIRSHATHFKAKGKENVVGRVRRRWMKQWSCFFWILIITEVYSLQNVKCLSSKALSPCFCVHQRKPFEKPHAHRKYVN